MRAGEREQLADLPVGFQPSDRQVRAKIFLLTLEADQRKPIIETPPHLDRLFDLACQSGPQDSRLSRIREDARVVEAQGERLKFGRRADADYLDLSDPPFIDLSEEFQRQVGVIWLRLRDIGDGDWQLVCKSR